VNTRVRVTAQLIEVATGNHFWADRYDREIGDIFEMQDDIVRTIVTTLERRLTTSIAQLTARRAQPSIAAYECLLLARRHLDRHEWAAVASLAQRAVELDPLYAQAHARLASACYLRFNDEGRAELLDQALTHAMKAVALDDSDAICHVVLGQTYLLRRQFDFAEIHFECALALNPNDVIVMMMYALWLCRVGRNEEALKYVDLVMERDPIPPGNFWEIRAIVLSQAKRYQDAIDSIRRSARLVAWNHAQMACYSAQLGKMEEARSEAARALRMEPGFTIQKYLWSAPFKNATDIENVRQSLLKAGLPP
jgi:adenylate cyclase